MTEALLAGRYRLVRRLGGGGQGTVHEGWDENLGRQVAVKTLNLTARGGLTHRAMMHGRFDREARALASLKDSHVVTIHDRGEHAGTPFIVMEYLAGPSLADELSARGPLPVAEVLGLAVQIAKGLQAAHRKGIAHRDIKPTNLILTSGRKLKICDFGLVTQLIAHAPRYTRHGGVLGSPGYMSPEQAGGQEADTRSDIYSFGVTLYALLTGGSPFAHPDPAESRARVLGPPPPPVSQWRADLPDGLTALIGRMMDPEPGRRPPIGQVRKVLEAAAARSGPLGGSTTGKRVPSARQAPTPAAGQDLDALVARERNIATAVPQAGQKQGTTLAERFWPRLEEAERLLEQRRFDPAETMFAQLSAELTALKASDHPAFFAALFGRARALAGKGRHTTARTRLTRLNDRIGPVLGQDHPLSRAVRRYLAEYDPPA